MWDDDVAERLRTTAAGRLIKALDGLVRTPHVGPSGHEEGIEGAHASDQEHHKGSAASLRHLMATTLQLRCIEFYVSTSW